jgi:hypothetical protein
VTAVHIAIGVGMVLVNAAAALLGGWQWWRGRPGAAFWPLLRTGQALTALAALDGVLVLAGGKDLPELHLVYGLTPLGVSFLAEQLRVASAQTVLDQRGLESSLAVGRLPEAEQRALVMDIVRREIGVMASSALVVCVLGLRAAGLL